MRAAWILAIFLTGCVGPAAEPEPEPPWHGRDLEGPWKSTVVRAGWMVEFDYARSEGDTLGWNWFIESQEPVLFDLHTHAGMARTLMSHNTTDHQGSFTVPESGTYSFTWTNTHGHDAVLYFLMAQDHYAATAPA